MFDGGSVPAALLMGDRLIRHLSQVPGLPNSECGFSSRIGTGVTVHEDLDLQILRARGGSQKGGRCQQSSAMDPQAPIAHRKMFEDLSLHFTSSGTSAKYLDFQIASVDSVAGSAQVLQCMRIWTCKSCVLAAEARKAEGANRAALRIPKPPSLTGKCLKIWVYIYILYGRDAPDVFIWRRNGR